MSIPFIVFLLKLYYFSFASINRRAKLVQIQAGYPKITNNCRQSMTPIYKKLKMAFRRKGLMLGQIFELFISHVFYFE